MMASADVVLKTSTNDGHDGAQQALRALRSGEHSGVLLHGLGRIGKSSLAARIADRCPEMALAVVFGDYSADNVLDAIDVAVRSNVVAWELIGEGRAAVRDRPEAVEDLLTDLLTGPCSQPAGDRRRRLVHTHAALHSPLLAAAAVHAPDHAARRYARRLGAE